VSTDFLKSTFGLFDSLSHTVVLDPGAQLLCRFAQERGVELLTAIDDILRISPFRRMMTPGGPMSVAMTNCGAVGWVTDKTGYRYDAVDPETGYRWPAMPQAFLNLAAQAAEAAGFPDFMPDACLVNCYEPGTRLSLHQDKDERDFSQPILSVSLGLPAIFLWGSLRRSDRPRRVPLFHGDVVVWGGPARLTYHGIHQLAEKSHPLAGLVRYNLTFRKAL
jgi:alkylated DNA repair protein (DNA oxidative demethylase)